VTISAQTHIGDPSGKGELGCWCELKFRMHEELVSAESGLSFVKSQSELLPWESEGCC